MGLLLDLLYQMCFKALITEGDVNRERNAVCCLPSLPLSLSTRLLPSS